MLYIRVYTSQTHQLHIGTRTHQSHTETRTHQSVCTPTRYRTPVADMSTGVTETGKCVQVKLVYLAFRTDETRAKTSVLHTSYDEKQLCSYANSAQPWLLSPVALPDPARSND